LTIILMALNVIQSIKRLRDMGVGIWWYLLPLYNPLALLIKKPGGFFEAARALDVEKEKVKMQECESNS